MPQQREVTHGEQYANFRRAKLEVGKLKATECIGCEVGFNREHKKRDQHAESDSRADKARQRHAPHQEEGGYGIADVIDVEAVAGTLPVANPSQRSVQAVSKPIQGEEENSKYECCSVVPGQGVTDSRQTLRDESENGEVVRVHPRRGALGQGD